MSSDSEDDLVAASVIIIATCSKRKKRKKVWTKAWLKKRTKFGVYDTLLREFRLEEEDDYFNFLRMTPTTFDSLLHLVEDDIRKQDTVMRDAIPPHLKLAATLRYLCTGECYSSLQYLFRIHRTTLGKFIPIVCDNLYSKIKTKIQVSFVSLII